MSTEQQFTVTATQLQALMKAIQDHLTGSANARAALSIIPQLDQQLVKAWEDFSKGVTPMPDSPPPAAPPDAEGVTA